MDGNKTEQRSRGAEATQRRWRSEHRRNRRRCRHRRNRRRHSNEIIGECAAANQTNDEPDQRRKQRRRCRDQVNSKRPREGEREPTVDEERSTGGAEGGVTAKAAAHNGKGPHTAARV
ncbi:hypothetical protein U1Q18_016912 [Sarracenia purpurea var. burkii]